MFPSLINCSSPLSLTGSNSSLELQHIFLFFLYIGLRASRCNSHYGLSFHSLQGKGQVSVRSGSPALQIWSACKVGILQGDIPGMLWLSYSSTLRRGMYLGGRWQMRLYSWLLLTWLPASLGSPASVRCIAMAAVPSPSKELRFHATPGSLENEGVRSAPGFCQRKCSP